MLASSGSGASGKSMKTKLRTPKMKGMIRVVTKEYDMVKEQEDTFGATTEVEDFLVEIKKEYV